MRPSNTRGLDKTVLLLLLGLLLFASPLLPWAARLGGPWYLPYVLWALLIGIIALAQGRRRHDDL